MHQYTSLLHQFITGQHHSTQRQCKLVYPSQFQNNAIFTFHIEKRVFSSVYIGVPIFSKYFVKKSSKKAFLCPDLSLNFRFLPKKISYSTTYNQRGCSFILSIQTVLRNCGFLKTKVCQCLIETLVLKRNICSMQKFSLYQGLN